MCFLLKLHHRLQLQNFSWLPLATSCIRKLRYSKKLCHNPLCPGSFPFKSFHLYMHKNNLQSCTIRNYIITFLLQLSLVSFLSISNVPQRGRKMNMSTITGRRTGVVMGLFLVFQILILSHYQTFLLSSCQLPWPNIRASLITFPILIVASYNFWSPFRPVTS